MKYKVYAIRIQSITNKLLIKDGWKIGMFVACEDSGYGSSFDIARRLNDADFFESNAEAMRQHKKRGEHFVGVSFEIVEFVER